jgi:hypothetical protein
MEFPKAFRLTVAGGALVLAVGSGVVAAPLVVSDPSGAVLSGYAQLSPYYVPQRYTPPRRRPNNQRRPNNNNRAQQKPRTGAVKGTNKAGVELQTEVQSLRDRHSTLVAKMPADMRRLDAQAVPVVEKLPLIAQLGYYTTTEDYATLGTPEQKKLKETMQSLADLREPGRQQFVDHANVTFGNLQNNETQLKAARSKPHDTCFRIKSDLDTFQAAAAPTTSTPTAATGTTSTTSQTGATSTTTGTTSTPAAKPKKKKAPAAPTTN